MSDIIEQLKAECRERGIEYHPRHGEDTLRSLLADADSGDTAPAPSDASAEIPEGYVQVKITKWGAGKVSDGKEGYFKRGDVVALPHKVAWQLDAKHFAEAD